ncbi:hypothetical protein HRG34_11205 [Enterococcus faecalis]|nr:hypothetical protein [Enterococcus faecalis]
MNKKKRMKKIACVLLCTTFLNMSYPIGNEVWATDKENSFQKQNEEGKWPNLVDYYDEFDEANWPKWSELKNEDYGGTASRAQVQHKEFIYAPLWEKVKQYDVEPQPGRNPESGSLQNENLYNQTGWKPVGIVSSSGHVRMYKDNKPLPLRSVSNPVVANYKPYSRVDAGQGKVWKEKLFVPYISTNLWYGSSVVEGGGLYRLLDEADKFQTKFVNIGPITVNPYVATIPSFGGKNNVDGTGKDLRVIENFSHQIKEFRNAGGDVMFTFGGEGTEPIGNALFKNYFKVEDAATMYKEMIQGYGLKNINFHYEEKYINDANAWSFNNDALKVVQTDLGNHTPAVWYTVDTTIKGISKPAQNLIKDALKKGISIKGINILTTDYGVSSKDNYYEVIKKSINTIKNQIQEIYKESGIKLTDEETYGKLGITPHIGKSSNTQEIFTHKDAENLKKYAQEKGIGMLSMISLNRDSNLAEEGKNPEIPQNIAYEFSNIFNRQQEESGKQTISIGGQGISGAGETHKSGFARVNVEVENGVVKLIKNSDYKFHWSAWQASNYVTIKITTSEGEILYNQSWKGNDSVKGNGYQVFDVFEECNLPEDGTVEIYHAEGSYHRFYTSDNDELKTKLGKTGNTYIYTMKNNKLELTDVK